MANPLKPTKLETVQIPRLFGNSENSRLQQHVGPMERLKASLATSKVAGEALRGLRAEQVKAQANVELTSLKLTEALIRSTLVGDAMPAIGALTTRVNAATTAVDQALTNGATAETYTHMDNRAGNFKLAHELLAAGKITEEELEVLVNFAQADAVEDIQRSRTRTQAAKEAVASLHEFALKGIAEAKEHLK